jgi:hypothetical protein
MEVPGRINRLPELPQLPRLPKFTIMRDSGDLPIYQLSISS